MKTENWLQDTVHCTCIRDSTSIGEDQRTLTYCTCTCTHTEDNEIYSTSVGEDQWTLTYMYMYIYREQ